MSQQIQISGGAKVRNLQDVIIGTSGVLSSLAFDVANGVPKLDSNGKILVSQLPNSVMEYKGTWNAATNTPTLANGTGNQGDVYLCNVAGTVDFGAGAIAFVVGDQVIYSGSIWQRASGATGTVTSVAVTESGDSLNITGSPITTSGTINIGFNGTNLQYVNGAGNLTTFPTLITSIGLSMPSAFSVANSPLTANGTIAVTGAGTTAQYIRGDGSLATFPTIATEAQRLITEVYNETGATLSKGTVVYINGGHGNLPTITKALATGDATSAQTYGIVQTDITNMNNGYVVVIGSLTDLDTSAYVEGTQLYLSSTTAGAWTSVKQYAPAHLVYVAIVTRSHPTQGVVEVMIQNGFEMDELHNVSAQSPLNNQGLFYNTSTSLWENKSIATALGYTPADDSLVVHLAGTETITGVKNFNIGLTLQTGYYPTPALGYVGLGSNGSGITILTKPVSTVYNNNLQFSAASNTYNFPAASGTIALTSDIPSLAGYVTLATTQTITGAKTFSGYTTFTSTVDITSGLTFSNSGFTLVLQPPTLSVNRTVTLPNGTGTIALTSDISYPVTSVFGRTGAVVATSGDYTTAQVTEVTNLYYTDARARAAISLTTTGTSGASTYNSTTGVLNIPNYAPDLSGYVTLAGSQTITGAKTFSTFTKFDGGVILKNNVSASLAGYVGLSAYSASGNKGINIDFDTYSASFYFSGTLPYQYTFPAASGTIALVGGSGVGTVTSVAALTIGTSGTDLSSSVANSTTTPVITLNVPTASATNRGALSSADWTTFNNKQSALTNPVTGTGTTNYLPKFTGTSTIGNSLVQDNGSTVSIITGSTVLSLDRTGGATALIELKTGGTVRSYLGADTSMPFVFFNQAASPLMYLNASGNLGLGVTPSYRLDVQNTSGFDSRFKTTSLGGTVGILLEANNDFSGTSQAYIKAILGSGNGQSTLTFGTATNVGDTTASEKMRLFPSGNLVVGGTTAGTSLNTSLTVNNPSAGNYSGLIAMTADVQRGYYGGTSTGLEIGVSGSGLLDIYTNGSPRIRATSGGNILIGTTTDAGYKLDVNGTGRFSGALNGTSASFSGIVTSNQYFDINGTSTPATVGSKLSLGYYTAGGYAWMQSWSSTPFIINPYGNNVGIGSSTAAYQLDVAGTFRATGAATFTGNVGIGTSSPTAISTFTTLEIRGATGGGIKIGKTSFAQFNIQHDGTDAYFNNTANGALYIYTNDAERVKVASSGAITCTSSVTATSFFESSDSRLKTLIQDNYQTKGIASITPKLYTKNGKVELGYYAQDFVGILDSAVVKGSDDMLSLSYREVLVAKVYALEQRIKELETK